MVSEAWKWLFTFTASAFVFRTLAQYVHIEFALIGAVSAASIATALAVITIATNLPREASE